MSADFSASPLKITFSGTKKKGKGKAAASSSKRTQVALMWPQHLECS